MKVFCIGQPKTGTKTMSKIFNKLGYKVNSNPICSNEYYSDYIMLDNTSKYYVNFKNNKEINCERANNKTIYENIRLFDAFHDIPYSNNYRFIYKYYPESKFILTLRDSKSWFKSLFSYQKIPGSSNYYTLYNLYGFGKFEIKNKKHIIEKYEYYNNEIINFFKDKPNKLLIINITNNINKNIELNKIGIFLNKNIDFELPCENEQKYEEEFEKKFEEEYRNN